MGHRPTKALVKLSGEVAGILARVETGIQFQYTPDYVARQGRPLSLSLPVRNEPYASSGLPPYFSGLVSEGWLRRVQTFMQRIDPADDFTLLVNNGRDLAGAVTVEPIDE